jgi:UDP-glucose 4-epimerase
LTDLPITACGDDDVPVVSLDPAETFNVFGWHAKVSFEETIRRQLDWYEKYGITDVFSHLKTAK